MRVVLLGAPGAGKGTQARLLATHFMIPNVGTGHMFRAAASADTELGREVNKFIREGALVPDDIVVRIVKERLSHADVSSGFVLDGFPRTVLQANELDEALEEKGRKLDVVISIEIKESELIERLSHRRTCRHCGTVYNTLFEKQRPKEEGVCDRCGGELVQRNDENPEVIKERLRIFNENNEPLEKYYSKKGLLKKVGASNYLTPQHVFADVLAALAK